MSAYRVAVSLSVSLLLATAAQAQDSISELSAKGKELYFERVSCWVCHGDDAEGRVGPTLQHGPSPLEMQEQLDSNPQMGVIVSELNPGEDDLIAVRCDDRVGVVGLGFEDFVCAAPVGAVEGVEEVVAAGALLIDLVGIDPHPGTVNLALTGEENLRRWQGWRELPAPGIAYTA